MFELVPGWVWTLGVCFLASLGVALVIGRWFRRMGE